MKQLIALFILFPVVAFAQSQEGMPPQTPMNMEKIQRALQQMDMGKMQEAMACMKDIDQSAFKGLEEEGNKMKAEIGALCRNGNRDEAQDKGMAYAKEMMARPNLKKIRECAKMAEGMLPKGAFEDLLEEGKNRHVCDDL